MYIGVNYDVVHCLFIFTDCDGFPNSSITIEPGMLDTVDIDRDPHPPPPPSPKKEKMSSHKKDPPHLPGK